MDIPEINYENLDFNVPKVMNTLDASTDILNRAPDILAFLSEAVFERKEIIENRKAEIIRDNPDKKQDEKKSIFQLDKVAKEARRSLSKAEAMLIRWEQAEKSAAKFNR